jgi:hypothetical protein
MNAGKSDLEVLQAILCQNLLRRKEGNKENMSVRMAGVRVGNLITHRGANHSIAVFSKKKG